MNGAREKIFICCRIGGTGETDHEKRADFLRNIERAKLYARWAILNGYDPESTGFYFCESLDDFNPDERKLGQELGRERLKKCDFILVVEDGRPHSSGMIGDIEAARNPGVKPIVITHNEIINWLIKNDSEAFKRMFPELYFEKQRGEGAEKQGDITNEIFDCYD